MRKVSKIVQPSPFSFMSFGSTNRSIQIYCGLSSSCFHNHFLFIFMSRLKARMSSCQLRDLRKLTPFESPDESFAWLARKVSSALEVDYQINIIRHYLLQHRLRVWNFDYCHYYLYSVDAAVVREPHQVTRSYQKRTKRRCINSSISRYHLESLFDVETAKINK